MLQVLNATPNLYSQYDCCIIRLIFWDDLQYEECRFLCFILTIAMYSCLKWPLVDEPETFTFQPAINGPLVAIFEFLCYCLAEGLADRRWFWSRGFYHPHHNSLPAFAPKYLKQTGRPKSRLTGTRCQLCC